MAKDTTAHQGWQVPEEVSPIVLVIPILLGIAIISMVVGAVILF